MANVRALASDFGDDVWLEKIEFRTQSPLNLEVQRERQDLIGRLLRDIDSLAAAPQSLSSLPEAKELAAKVAVELSQDVEGDEAFSLEDPVRQAAWLRDAEALLLSHLVRDSGEQS